VRETMREGVQRAGYGGENVLCQFAWIQPGTAPRPHRHDCEQVVIVIEGHCHFHIEEVAHPCGPGSLLRIPPNALHWIEVTGDQAVFEIDIFAPVRPDYAHLLDHQRGEWTPNEKDAS